MRTFVLAISLLLFLPLEAESQTSPESAGSVSEANKEQFVMKLKIVPEECVIFYGMDGRYDMGMETIVNGVFEKSFSKGTVSYRIENDFYETYTGIYQVNASSPVENISLKPAFGFIRVKSEPDSADVYLDGRRKIVGKTPFDSGMLIEGRHTIRLVKQDYYIKEISFNVEPNGAIQEVPLVRLLPQFGEFVCQCEDPEAELSIKDASDRVVRKIRNGETVRLNSKKNYKLEASKVGCKSQSVGLLGGEQMEGKLSTVLVVAPIPIYGGLKISSNPKRAEVLIDGQLVGETSYVETKQVGEYQVELRHTNYSTQRFSITVEEAKDAVVECDLKTGKHTVSYSSKKH